MGSHVIKDKTIYQLNGNNDLLKTSIDSNPILGSIYMVIE